MKGQTRREAGPIVRARYLVLGILGAAIVSGGLFVALRYGFPTPDSTLPPASATAPAPVETGATGVASAPKVTDVPAAPDGLASKVAEKGEKGLTAEERAAWDKYLAETAAVVSDNADAFRSALETAVAAIIAGDAEGLSASFAPDENVSDVFVQSLASVYPPIEQSASQPTVSVFAVNDATVYFGYSVVRWQDGGIISEHTIAVPMRFVGARWYLTSIGSGTGGLRAVQSVRIGD